MRKGRGGGGGGGGENRVGRTVMMKKQKKHAAECGDCWVDNCFINPKQP